MKWIPHEPSPARRTADGRVVNAMSIDLEDYYHAAALASAWPRASWPSLPSRVEPSGHRTLDLLDRYNVKATFFTLGSVGKQFPQLVRRVVADGHEIASHGWAHYRVGEQTPRVFADDVAATKKTLEDLTGSPVTGYRAANFSIDLDTWWAFEVLAEAGYTYSSSVNPIAHDHYGVRSAPRFPFRPAGADIVEIPMTAVEWRGLRFPAAGGGYFRLLPYAVYRRAIRAFTAQSMQPGIFYFHPWEIDPEQPRAAVGGHSRFRHYVNLATMEGKLERVLGEFAWSRMDKVFATYIRPRPEAPAATVRDSMAPAIATDRPET